MKMRMVSTEDGVEYWFDITESIQMILGNVVKSAEIMMVSIPSCASEQEKGGLIDMYTLNLERRKHYAKKMQRFDFDGHPLEITFTNDYTIRMQGSEWASFQLIKD